MIKKNVVMWFIVAVIEYIALYAIGGWIGTKSVNFLDKKFPWFKEEDES